MIRANAGLKNDFRNYGRRNKTTFALGMEGRCAGMKKHEKDILRSMAPVSDQLISSAGITSGQMVLDVATGTGEPALTIAKIVGPAGKVSGVDLSPEMLQIAKQRAASQGLTNVVFQAVEDESLSMFQDNTFDSVVCRNGLMFMPDPVKALKAFRRVLKPGGKASVTVWGSPDKAPVMDTHEDIIQACSRDDAAGAGYSWGTVQHPQCRHAAGLFRTGRLF